MKNKFLVVILIILVVAGGIFGYITYQKNNLESSVIEYLTTKEDITEENIVSTESFIANLPGNRNFLVSVKLKNDQNTYYYYKNEDNQIVLESYTDEKGYEHVND